jgi:hypothetical protein
MVGRCWCRGLGLKEELAGALYSRTVRVNACALSGDVNVVCHSDEFDQRKGECGSI